MTRKKKNEVAKSPQNSSEWHALLEREGLLLLWELIFVTPALIFLLFLELILVIPALKHNVPKFSPKALHKYFQV